MRRGPRDFSKEVKSSVAREAGVKAWMQARVELIKNQISAGDVLSRHGVELHKHGDQEEQISCPFHGTDKKPSARYFPDRPDDPSHVWCFVCHERWDVFKLWTKFTNVERFGEVMFQIERAFGITPPETNMIPEMEAEYNPLTDTVEDLFNVCEETLREYRAHFDMKHHLTLGAILDQTRFRLDLGALTLVQTEERLRLVFDKILKVVERAKASADPES